MTNFMTADLIGKAAYHRSGAYLGRIADLVMATASHEAPAHDPDAQLLLDIDLAILGASPART